MQIDDISGRIRSYEKYGKRIFRETRFTLIELLLIIAIIVILTGMLMPALSRAKMCSYSAVCKNNLRQIGISSMNYSADFSGYLPLAGLFGFTPYADGGFHILLSYDYMKKDQWTCPADTTREGAAVAWGGATQKYWYKYSWDQGAVPSYLWNICTSYVWASPVPDYGSAAKKLSQLKFPQNDWLAGDGETQTSSCTFYYKSTILDLMPVEDFVRHGSSKVNFIFADGHTEAYGFKFNSGMEKDFH